jgi:trigger factor
MRILSEMAERALAHCYPHIVEAHELEVIGHPKIEITKLAPLNPLGFTATVAVLPTVTLPDYQKIAREVNQNRASLEVTDEELSAQIEQIMRSRLAYERLQHKAAQSAQGTSVTIEGAATLPTPESEAAKHEEDEAFDPATAPLPELTDAYVQGLGQPGQFENVEDFKTKLREHLTIEKTREGTATHRAKLTDAIIEGSEMTLPRILIDSELQQMLAHMREDLARANMRMEEYLTHIKKTESELLADWTPAAEKRAKLQLVLNEIAKRENITPDEGLLERQTSELLARYKDADPMRVRVYVASILQNEAVMQLLETRA